MYDDKTLFLEIYKRWILPQYDGECGEEDPLWQWAHEKARIYQNIIPGALAPYFEMDIAGINTKLSLYDIQADYTLLVFWASWCPHCRQEIPRIRDLISEWQKQYSPQKSVQVVAISLDTNPVEWQKFIQEHQLSSWLHYSGLKGWKGSIHKLYNIYATPTIYLLDREKKIIGSYDIIEKAVYKMSK